MIVRVPYAIVDHDINYCTQFKQCQICNVAGRSELLYILMHIEGLEPCGAEMIQMHVATLNTSMKDVREEASMMQGSGQYAKRVCV